MPGTERLLEAVANRMLRLDPDSLRRFGELDGKAILLELVGDGTSLQLYVLPSRDGVGLRRDYDGSPDVTISGTATVFLNQLWQGPTVSDALVIRGDIELGQRFQRIISRLSPDWEEGLSRVIGDIPAHQVGRLVSTFLGWGKAAVNTLSMDAAEYLQEESLVLAKRERVEEFFRHVDQLRADTDRLEKRIERLSKL